jgi:hypothetical protein
MDSFTLKLALGFLVGGAWVITATIIAERAGTKAGGVIAGLPSAVVVTLFFIGWTQSPQAAADATTLIPASAGVAGFFNVAYAALYPKGFRIALPVALAVWFLFALGLVLTAVETHAASLVTFTLFYLTSVYILEKRLSIPSKGRRPTRYTFGLLLFRGCLGGGIVVFAVTMARISGPLVGGLFSVFPTIMLSTMIINHLTHGPEFATAFVKAITFSGPVNSAVYGLAVRYTYPDLGIVQGSLIAFAISLVSGCIVYSWVRRRTS